MDKKNLISDGNVPFLFSSARHTDVECVTHIHITMEIVLVTNGVLHMTIGGTDYDICEGYGAFIPPFEPHTFHSKQFNNCHVIMFSKELVSYFFEFIKKNSPKRHIFAVSEASMKLAQEILPDNNNSPDCIGAEAVLAPLCRDICKGCEFESRKHSFDDTAYLIFKYVDAHFTEPLKLSDAARAVGIHPVTISKIFSKHMGVGFNYYLQYQRCTYGARLIKTTDMSFSEIAFEAGFGSIRSFNRAFQSIYGTTPTHYKVSFGGI